MRFIDFIKDLRRRVSDPAVRDDLLMIALSLIMAVGVTLIWTWDVLPSRDASPVDSVPYPQAHLETSDTSSSGKPAGEKTAKPEASAAHNDETSAFIPYPASTASGGARKAGAPLIAIVLDDMGPNKENTERALKLPPSVTFAFLPYAKDVAVLAAQAKGKGHELLVHVPMEPAGAVEPGPHALRVTDAPEKILEELRWNLSQLSGYVGINNHMGSRFTADETSMRIVVGELKTRKLLLLDSRTTKDTQAAPIAQQAGVPSLSRDVFLDNEEGSGEVTRELERLEKLAREKGSAVAIGHPHPATLDVLQKWLPQAEKRGIKLVPLTQVLKFRQGS